MSNYLDDDDDLGRRRNERELTLSTGSILGIFFGLALLCALFFGFGYNMGRKSSPAIPIANNVDGGNDSDSGSLTAPVSTTKPSAGSYVNAPTTTKTVTETTDETAATSTAPSTVPAANKLTETTSKLPGATAPARTPVTNSGTFGSGSFVVQVAAVSHQEDADLLVNALHRKGYSVAARNETSDKLVHIQVGPFSDHKEADAMKTRLISDGYNAIIKQL